MSKKHRYRYCGVELHSDFPIPELALVSGSGPAHYYQICRQVDFISNQETLEWISPVLALGHKSVIWQLPGIARFRISRTEPLIEVAAAPASDWDSIRLFLLHPVFVLSRMLQGDFMLRAACAAIDDQAVALVGSTACGKSTLAAALYGRGYTLLSDGLLRIVKDENGMPVAFPQAPWMLLWPDSIKTLELSTEKSEAVGPGLDLFRHHVVANERPLPIKRILMMREQRGNDQALFESEEREGFSGFQLIRHFTAGECWLHPLNALSQHFQWSIEFHKLPNENVWIYPGDGIVLKIVLNK